MRNVKGFLYVILLFILLMNCGVKREIKFEQGKDTLYEAVRLIMTGPEKKIFKKLPSEESKEEFMKEFWKKRDPDLSTEENEFKKEFENRLAYANLRFKSEGIPGWKTDRGRIYMYLGPPDQVYEQPYLNYSNLKGYLVWVYYKYRLGVEFMDRTGTNKYDLKINSTHSFRLMDASDRAKFGLIYSVEAEMEKKPGQIEVDFDNEKREIVVRIPSSSLFYKEEKMPHDPDSKEKEYEYRFEKIIAAISRFNIFAIGFLIFLAVFLYWVIPDLIVYLGRVGTESVARYKWIFLSAAVIFLGLIIWMIYLRYLLAKKTIDSHTEIKKCRMQLEYDKTDHIPLQLDYDPEENSDAKV